MCCARAPAPARTPTERSAVKQLGVGWNWRDLAIGDRFVTYGRTLFEADLLVDQGVAAPHNAGGGFLVQYFLGVIGREILGRQNQQIRVTITDRFGWQQ